MHEWLSCVAVRNFKCLSLAANAASHPAAALFENAQEQTISLLRGKHRHQKQQQQQHHQDCRIHTFWQQSQPHSNIITITKLGMPSAMATAPASKTRGLAGFKNRGDVARSVCWSGIEPWSCTSRCVKPCAACSSRGFGCPGCLGRRNHHPRYQRNIHLWSAE